MNFPSLEDLGDVKVEEIAVEDRLDAAGYDGDDVVEALEVVTVDPVQDVQTPVRSEREEIMRCDRLGLARLGHHEELRQNGHRLQIDGERPEHLHNAELVIEEERQNRHGTHEELDPERVVVVIVGGLELDEHQVDGAGG